MIAPTMALKALLLALVACATARPESTYFPANLDFAADNFADLFLNGVKLTSLYSWAHFSRIELDLKVGDVIAIKVTDVGSKYGVIADLSIGNGQYCQTKINHGPWRAVRASNVPDDWIYASYNPKASSWPYPAQSNVSPPSPGSAKYFPYLNGAQYVWAHGASAHTSIYLRLVVPRECATLDFPEY